MINEKIPLWKHSHINLRMLYSQKIHPIGWKETKMSWGNFAEQFCIIIVKKYVLSACLLCRFSIRSTWFGLHTKHSYLCYVYVAVFFPVNFLFKKKEKKILFVFFSWILYAHIQSLSSSHPTTLIVFSY